MSNSTTSKPVAKYSDFFGEILVEEITINDSMESYTVQANRAAEKQPVFEIAPNDPGFVN